MDGRESGRLRYIGDYTSDELISNDGVTPNYRGYAYYSLFYQEAIADGEEDVQSYAEIRYASNANPMVITVTGAPEFDYEDVLDNDEFEESGNYSSVPDCGYYLFDVETKGVRRNILELVPGFYDIKTAKRLVAVASGHDEDTAREEIESLYKAAHCLIPLNYGAVQLFHEGRLLLEIADGAQPGEGLERNDGKWTGLNQYKLRRRGKRYRFECVSSETAVYNEDDVINAKILHNPMPDPVARYFVISGLKFNSQFSDVIVNQVRQEVDGRSVDELGVRRIIEPYIKLVPAPIS